MIFMYIGQVGLTHTISLEYDDNEHPAEVCDFIEKRLNATVLRYHNMTRLHTATIIFTSIAESDVVLLLLREKYGSNQSD